MQSIFASASVCAAFRRASLRTAAPLFRSMSRTATPFPSFVGNAALDDVKDAMDRRPFESTESTGERWETRSKKAVNDVANHPPPNAYTGRTVLVKGDVGLAFKSLEVILQRNKVRLAERMGQRHEKKGVKRRRLSSQRWRKLFADEVRRKVQLVMKIRDRGA